MKPHPKINSVPVVVQQAVMALLDGNNPEHIAYNHLMTITNIRDVCDKAIADYTAAQMKKKVFR